MSSRCNRICLGYSVLTDESGCYTYTILTQNLGPNTAAGVTVTDSIIPGLTGVTATG
ncbi:MAG: hypothetical protein HC849_21735, partial [Oscillatoriales cyanobacterium RU_3_3]|nr:hypothetical protein [Oscillatoriales cyanobacterium RU_3_3]